MIDRFEELRTYVAIVDAGGVNAAAARIGIARSAVSRRLSELEIRIGTVLVERSTRRFELTAVGRSYYDESRRMLDELAAMDDRFGGTPTAERITVSIARDFAGLIAPALVRFRAAQANATVELVDAAVEAAGNPDVMITVGEAGGGRGIAELTRIVVGSPGYLEERGAPGTLSDLEAHVGISVPGAPDDWTFRKGLQARPAIAFVVDDGAAALALALAGAGLAHLPHHICADALERGALAAVLPDQGPKPVPVMAQALGTSRLAAALVDQLASRKT